MNFVRIGNRIINLALVTMGTFSPISKSMELKCTDGTIISLKGNEAQCLIDLIETPVIASPIEDEAFRHIYLNTHPKGQTEEEWQKTLASSDVLASV